MGLRSKRSVRCRICRMHPEVCVCAHIPSLDLRTQVVVVMHRREWSKTTATAPLARLALQRCEVHLHGDREAPVTLGEHLFAGRSPVVLFPSDDAVELSPEWVDAQPHPVTLMVPDGSWRQAFKIAKRLPALKPWPRVTLPASGASRYRLRAEPKLGGLATFEAISRALGIIEGPDVQAPLDRLFHAMVEGTLRTRGQHLTRAIG